MKLTFLILPFTLWLGIAATAQTGKEECTHTYFKNKKVASSKCMHVDGYKGKSIAYNLEGEIIGEWMESRMHMLAGVHFTFHANGMVHKAEYSSHPDAGIQWYRSTTEYNDKGEKIGFWEHSHDDRVTLIQPAIPPAPAVVPDKKEEKVQEVIECAVIYVSELWVDNRTGKDINILIRPKYLEGEQADKIVSIKNGQRAKLGEQIQAQFYESPLSRYDVIILQKRNKLFKNTKLSATPFIGDERIAENRRMFVYDVVLK